MKKTFLALIKIIKKCNILKSSKLRYDCYYICDKNRVLWCREYKKLLLLVGY